MLSPPTTTRYNPCQEKAFGYFSAIETQEHGFFGGYLLISLQGRPLEFHCTAPVQPSRAQEILYGPTLRPYLLGEQIGGTLVAKAELTPVIVLIDQPAALSLRSHFDVPLVCLVGNDNSDVCDLSQAPTDSIVENKSRRLDLLAHSWELAPGYDSDRATAETLLTELAEHVDLSEPFGRIHEAIREAQRIDERGPETRGQAA